MTTLAKRLIACLDVRNGAVVKGIKFEGLRDAGDPVALARRHDADGIDELVLLDVTATLENRGTFLDTVRAVADNIFIPFTVGGGIRSLEDARAVFDAGADKVSINSAALQAPDLITTLASLYGSQAVIVAMDVAGRDQWWDVFSRSGTSRDRRDALTWAREAEDRGAGEILLTSIDRDGTREGFDLDLTSLISGSVGIPVIASGGAGTFEHFSDVFTTGQADAALAASVFHFNDHAVADLKAFLAARNIPVRPASSC